MTRFLPEIRQNWIKIYEILVIKALYFRGKGTDPVPLLPAHRNQFQNWQAEQGADLPSSVGQMQVVLTAPNQDCVSVDHWPLASVPCS